MTGNNIVPIKNARTWQMFRDQINAAWQKGVESIIETGALLAEAKIELGHGGFEAMVNDKLPFGPRTAQHLKKIAANPVLSNTNHGSHLPPSWRTLSELAKLDDATLRAKIKDGTINPKMERRDAAALRQTKPKKDKAAPKASVQTTFDAVHASYVRAATPLTREERIAAIRALIQAIGLTTKDFGQLFPISELRK